MPWKVGTPLPHVAAGYKLMAWPSQAAMRHLRPGHVVALTRVVRSTARSDPRAYRAVANPAGYVNLEAVPDISTCGPVVFSKDLGSESTNVIQSYSTIGGVTQTAGYGNGQSSTLEVGISTSGSAGSFSADGSNSVSTDKNQGFTPQTGVSFNHFQTYFENGLYTQECPGVTYHFTQMFAWNAGAKYVHPSGAPGATYCTPEPPGSSFGQSSTTATTFGVGFTVGPIGFTGSAQTGYSSTASISFAYSKSAPPNGQLCGTLAKPGRTAPGVLVAS